MGLSLVGRLRATFYSAADVRQREETEEEAAALTPFEVLFTARFRTDTQREREREREREKRDRETRARDTDSKRERERDRKK